MQSKALKIFTIVFAVITLGELISSNYNGYEYLHYYFKPAIVTSLMLFFWSQSKKIKKGLRMLFTFALVFSLIGDILLMFVDRSTNFFLCGLVSFLIAHLIYVLGFGKQRNKTVKPLGFIVFLLIYAAGLFYLLLDGLKEMLIPVVIYMLVILSMATMAYLRKGMVSNRSYYLVLIGAILFLVSDSILALNKFYEPQLYSSISIMLTYALAQYFIVIGILKESESY